MTGLKPITKQSTKKILEQMENAFYEIKTKEGKIGICCFCHIKIKNINIPVLITNKKLIIESNLTEIKIYLNNVFVNMEIGEIRYKIKECNFIILEIKVKKDIKTNYLEFDNLLYKKEPELYYYNETIYNSLQ